MPSAEALKAIKYLRVMAGSLRSSMKNPYDALRTESWEAYLQYQLAVGHETGMTWFKWQQHEHRRPLPFSTPIGDERKEEQDK